MIDDFETMETGLNKKKIFTSVMNTRNKSGWGEGV